MKIDEKQTKDFFTSFLSGMSKNYWIPLYEFLNKNKDLIKTFPAFLLYPEQIVLYIGRTHIGIEYIGKELTDKLYKPEIINVKIIDYTEKNDNLFEKIVGFGFQSTVASFTLPLPSYSEDIIYPTNKGMDKLMELKWNLMAQDSILSINGPGFHIVENQFTRLVNARFFDADENGLKTRHIKWLDLIPIKIRNETNTSHEISLSFKILNHLVERDAYYRYPLPEKDDFKYNKLPQINRFIELIGNSKTTELQLTKFLEQEENQFILTMGILSTKIYPQLTCKWQSEKKNSIKPDFFILRANGYGDIVEFKLPNTKNKTIVGKANRESFSSEINSYIAQTRVYKEYFEDPNNRKWVKEKYGLNVRHPKRYLIVGRRWDFSDEVWKEIIEDYKDIEIITYDELIDGVVSQFYM